MFKLFTFTYYIRYFIEIYLILMLGSLNELYFSDFGNIGKIISYVTSIILILLLLGILLISYISAKKAADINFDAKKTYFSEFTMGTKEKFTSKINNFLYLLKILFSVAWIVFSISCNNFLRILIFCIIQLIFALIKTVVRPFEEIKENIIEILNDWIYFCICSIILVHYDSKDWGIFEGTVVTIMTLNSIIIMVIHIIFMVYSGILYLRKKRKQNKILIDTTNLQIKSPHSSKNENNVTQEIKMLSFGTNLNISNDDQMRKTSKYSPNSIDCHEVIVEPIQALE